MLVSIVLMKPSVEKMARARAYTRTQLMKLGIVVKVWTNCLKRVFLISERKIANAIGSQLVAIPRPLIARVLRSTITISFLVASFWNNCVNHLKPTKLSADKVPPDL